jgi:prevent-host-death family protein
VPVTGFNSEVGVPSTFFLPAIICTLCYQNYVIGLWGSFLEGVSMPIIKPISSLRNQTRNIAALCHEQDEPVYLTTNGEGDLVVMSIEHYERIKARFELFEKLAVAQAQAAAGEKGFTHSQVVKKLRQRLHAKTS